MKHLLSVLIFAGSCALAAEATLPAIQLKQVYSTYRIGVYYHDRFIGSGSGTAISKRQILTAGHVAKVHPGVTFQCDMFDEKGMYKRSVPLKIVRSNGFDDESNDLALMEAAEDLPYFVDIKYGTAAENDFLYVIGAAKGCSPQHIGIGRYKERYSDEVFGLSSIACVLAGGNSGGGVWNFKHELMGVLVQGDPNTTFCLFVTADKVQAFLNPPPAPAPSMEEIKKIVVEAIKEAKKDE